MKLLNPFEVEFSGVHLIEASAGTGKTYNISSLYIRALIETKWTVDQILVVTYTEAATKELRDRLMKRLRESIDALEGKLPGDDSFLNELVKNVEKPLEAISRLKEAIYAFDEAAVYTIHGFCRHALQEQAFNSGAPFEAELIGDDSDIIREIIDDYWRKWVREASENVLKRPLLKLLLDKGYSPDALTRELAGYVGKPYLKVEPHEVSSQVYDEHLYELGELFNDLQEEWRQSQEEIFELLNAGHLSYYRTDWLQNWMLEMHQWLRNDVAPIHYFDKFSRFSQSHINQSLKKSSEKKGVHPPGHSFFKYVDRYVTHVEELQDYEVIFKRRLFEYIVEKADEKKVDLQVYSFDDLLIQLQRALDHPEKGERLQNELRRAYPIALVDEFQDTDPIQYDIFSSIYEGGDEAALFMIGDPKQSIYSFRGADIFSYLKAKEDAPPQNKYSLGHNYRSVPPLIDAFNTLFESHENPFLLDDISFEPVQAGLETDDRLTVKGSEVAPLELRQLIRKDDEGHLHKTEAKKRAAEDTAHQIAAMLSGSSAGEFLIGGKPIEGKDIAVLVRSHYQATLIGDALRDRGIKSVKHSRESVFHSEEAVALYQILKAVVEPGSEQRVTVALATNLFSYSAREILSLKENETAWSEKLEQFVQWHEMWQDHGFAYMFRKMMQKEQVAETVMQLKNGERILTNLIHLSELIMQEEKDGKAGMHTLLKWLLKKRKEDNKDKEEEQLRLESDENLVSVVTMHHSKGLEYPVVFCPYLWDSPQNSDDGGPIVYHDPEDDFKEKLDLNGKNDPDRAQKRFYKAEEELAEGVRLAYVAITRAKYKCIIDWAYAKDAAHSPLGFLLLGHDEALKSLRASVDSDVKYSGDELSLYQSAIGQLAEHRNISSTVITDEGPEQRPVPMNEPETALQAKEFQRALPLPKGEGMASFSSLIRNEEEDFELEFRAYYDEPYDREEEWEQSSAAAIFDFPKGPNPGTAIHHIFENIVFGDESGWDAEIETQLQTQNIASRWMPVVKRMIELTLDKPLSKEQPQLKLSALDKEDMIEELEFYFTNGDIQLSEILNIIRPDGRSSSAVDSFAEAGFLKGFIDLTFKYKDRFYILDYKTNYLGNTINEYAFEALEEEMKEALYDVQYHLYVVALHRLLENKKKNYSYERNFGGAFYLFLRGMNKHGREGIFFDRPDKEIITQLNAYLKQQL